MTTMLSRQMTLSIDPFHSMPTRLQILHMKYISQSNTNSRHLGKITKFKGLKVE